MFELIDNLMMQASQKFGKNLSIYHPRQGKNGFNEKNLTYKLAYQFESTTTDSNINPVAFMEVPLKNPKNNRFDLHIDTILINESSVILVEAKRLYSVEKMRAMNVDWERMNESGLNTIIKSFPNRKIYKLIIAESWNDEITNWWVGEETKIKWDRTWLPKHVGSHPVTDIGKYSISWLYAIESLMD
ncbi:hypothetical protein M2263_001315 [Providencia alcalifaciens]|nr:hypothetical protein [Providencia alcalifaciens]